MRFDHWVAHDSEAAFLCEEKAGESIVLSYGEIDLLSDALERFLITPGHIQLR